jgi:type II secretory pathway component PulJ|tara:strand:- start:7544 stop:8059 length:516 start_codon:yes stop_codon:yes gene_type:complete
MQLNTIYRFKFTEQMMGNLTEFAGKHRYDENPTFRERWDRWRASNEEIINRENENLTKLGYTGDIYEKMYKTVRYYLKNKSLEKKEVKKRRKYVPVEKDILTIMDYHITNFGITKNMKPAFAYNNFMSLSEYSNELTEEVTRLMVLGLSEPEADAKIKKTYKNRYFTQQKV